MDRPNIVIITLHDTGKHFGCYGTPGVETPNIDQLAAEGVRFEHCFCASPVCSPSRGAMMTGRYPQSNGLMGLAHQPWWWEMNDDEQHLSQLLTDCGYDTHLFHIQHETKYPEQRLSFKQTHRCTEGAHRPTAIEVGNTFASALPNLKQADTPFYAAIGFFETHTRYDYGGAKPINRDQQVVPPFLRDDDWTRDHLAGLAGNLKQADNGVGLILQALKDNDLEENTLVIFTVDHGVEFGRRAKWSCHDAGIEIGLIMRWPHGNVSDGKVVDSLVSNVDVLPTLLELIGADIPTNVQGQSFAPILRGDRTNEREAIFAMFTNNGDPRCVRTERYKLIRNFGARRPWAYPHGLEGGPVKHEPAPFVELYDLHDDPHEMNNLHDDPALAETRRELDARLLDWMKQVGDPLLQGPIATPYYQQAIADFTGAN